MGPGAGGGQAATGYGHAVQQPESAGGPDRRAPSLAGDLSADGSIGSRTAFFREPYADNTAARPDHRGHAYLDAEQVSAHLVACVEAGVQAGFHVIGDAALDADTVYKVATNDYMLGGGDGYGALGGGRVVVDKGNGVLMANNVMDYVAGMGTVTASVEGRIKTVGQ